MKKSNEKGFMLVETLIVSVFILGALVFLFTQFRNVNQNYQTAFKYNTVDALYAAENMKKFYLQDTFPYIVETYRNERMKYLNLSDCPASHIGEVNYCQRLMQDLQIKTIILTDQDTSYIKDILDGANDIEPSMKSFIRYIKNDDTELLKYRLIVEMMDGTFATVKIY